MSFNSIGRHPPPRQISNSNAVQTSSSSSVLSHKSGTGVQLPFEDPVKEMPINLFPTQGETPTTRPSANTLLGAEPSSFRAKRGIPSEVELKPVESETQIHQLQEGEFGFAVPWALEKHGAFLFSHHTLRPSYTVKEPGGTSTLKVARVNGELHYEAVRR